jgi:hypothetical protein
MRNNIRRPLYDGMREVHAIWFDIGLLGEAQARRRVLAQWQTGARLHLADGGYLLSLVKPVHADCATLGGLALCKADGVLSSAPLASDERRAAAHGACLLVRGAQVQVVAMDNEVDPAAWIDLDSIALCMPLTPPAGKAFAGLPIAEESKSLRSILDNVIAPPSAQREAFMRSAMAAANKKKTFSASSLAASVGMTAAAGALTALMGVGMLPLLLGRWLGFGAGTSGGGGGGDGDASPQRHRPDPAWMLRLNAALARLAGMTKISTIIGWRQAAYLRKMVAMFDEGDIGEALRHAIPLGGDFDSVRQAMGQLRARSSLDITAAGGTASAIFLDPSLQQYLRDAYRKLFQRLEREGRIDEATFVLAELLQAGIEAVDYLERNGRLRQAAQLAETLALAPEVAVRLWVLAGNATRAVQIARASGAFADAVRLLERKKEAQASGLRVLWAEYLAERGDLAEAADAIWPLTAYRSVALLWLTQAEQVGRATGARALVRRLALMPESLADSLATIAAMLDQQGDAGVMQRTVLATELLALAEHSGATRRLAEEVLRHTLAERAAGLNAMSKADFNKLRDIARPPMLRSDLPQINFPAPRTRMLGSDATPLRVRGGERALLAIHDARRLPDGHYLLALGESGVLRITAKGKHVVHFPLPAYQLVLATNGEKALALARRGDVVRASRIDLASCKVSDWLSHPFDFWAAQYDGVVWNVVIDNRIMAIDTTKDQLAVVWQVADLPGRVFDFLDDGAEQVILMAARDEQHLWRYSLPARRLAQRDIFPFPAEDAPHLKGVAGNPTPAVVRLEPGETEQLLTLDLGRGALLRLGLGAAPGLPAVHVQDGWVLVQSRGEDGAFRCQVADPRTQKVVAELLLPDAHGAAVRAHGKHLLMFDHCGRLVDVDCLTGTVLSLSLS